jgi:hypothetical protein
MENQQQFTWDDIKVMFAKREEKESKKRDRELEKMFADSRREMKELHKEIGGFGMTTAQLPNGIRSE